jgi:hypothetical protein
MIPPITRLAVICAGVVLAIVACCAGKYPPKPPHLNISEEEHQRLMKFSPLYRDLVKGRIKHYTVETQEFLERVKRRHNPEALREWALRLIEEHKGEGMAGIERENLPDFILKFDPPYKSFVLVTKESVIIDHGGGFGHWGLQIGARDFQPNHPLQYTIEWVPGIYAYHTLQTAPLGVE